MHDERARIAFEQQVLAAPSQALDPLADDHACDIARHALPQVGIAHGDARDGFPEHERLDAATGDLDFRKLWHGGGPAVLVRPPNIPKIAPSHGKASPAQATARLGSPP